jgi:predicted CoA-substrate-specific enzyme activase
MMYAAGVDVGSTQTKAIVLDENRAIAGRSLVPTGARVTAAAERAYAEAIGSRETAFVVGTVYGRFKVTFGDDQITEITCHARGAQFLFPTTRTVIDIGGQDTKVIRVGPAGEVLDFAMNDKCAAGTGRFLSAAADVLGLTLEEIGPRSMGATDPVRLSSVCTVFVESDLMSYLAQGRSVPDILAGVHQAIAARTMSLVRRCGLEPEYTMTGGVARNPGMVRCLEEKLGARLNVGEESHFMGAVGAALFALERAEAARRDGREHAELGRWEAP